MLKFIGIILIVAAVVVLRIMRPKRSLIELRAAYTPDAARSVSGHPPSLSRRKGHPRF